MNEEETCCEAPMPEMEQLHVKEGYVPNAAEILKDFPVSIKVLDCGAIINVGCKSIAFSTLQEALEQFNLHFIDPVASYKKWYQRFIQG
jgi:hypothetical protein